ncbi:MAG: hypothetical protein V7677_16485 [Motiliproteus sp.]
MRILLAVLICFISVTAVADSISVTLKPERGLSGTASLNIHADGSVTILVYESPSKISENAVNIESNQKEELRSLTLSALNSYLNESDYESLKKYPFTLSVAHTVHGVTKNVSSKRMNKEAIEVLKKIILLNPSVNLKFVAEQI